MEFWSICIICSAVYAAAANGNNERKLIMAFVWLVLGLIAWAAERN